MKGSFHCSVFEKIVSNSHLCSDAPVNNEFSPFIGQIYGCTLQKLRSQEVDQEVKERAIACMGQILANMGDILNNELNVCLPIFLERLRNEVTRLSAVKALISIAASPLRIDLTPILVRLLFPNFRELPKVFFDLIYEKSFEPIFIDFFYLKIG